MLTLLLLFFSFSLGVLFSETYVAPQNFDIEPTGGASFQDALSKCLTTGLCHPTQGCCNGQGKCQASTTTATCVCRNCPGTAHYYTSASNCASLADSTAWTACCGSDTAFKHIFQKDGYCNQRSSGVYKPELGARGKLGRHVGTPRYGDNLSTYQANDTMINSWIADLTNGSSYTNTSFNQFSVALLQVAIKDTMDWELDLTQPFNLSYGGQTKTYYKLKKQTNTGVHATTANVDVPAAFPNIATTAIDVGPLYDYATRSVRSGLTLPYLDESAATTFWDTKHHMTQEFLLIVQLYAKFHNYVVRNLEDTVCGANTVSANIDYSDCTVWALMADQTNQDFSNWVYETARRSTIRFSQVLLEQSALYILLENPVNQKGMNESRFDYWIRRDVPRMYRARSDPNEEMESYTKVRQHQEFSSFHTRTDYSQNLISGLDHFISYRNPNMDLSGATGSTLLGDGSSCGTVVDSFARKIIVLMRTRARRWGKVDPAYGLDLKLNFHRVNELGLDYYNAYAQELTDSVTLLDIPSNQNVYYGIQKESNSARQYSSVTPSVAFAAALGIHDAIMMDPTNFFHQDIDGNWLAQNYHPQLMDVSLDLYTQDFCHGGTPCTGQAYNGWNIISELNDFTSVSGVGTTTRSRGAMFRQPSEEFWYNADYDGETYEDYQRRYFTQGTAFGELGNVLFYQFDGPDSMVLHLADTVDYFVVNPVVDALPWNIGWLGPFDGFCYDSNIIANYCTRAETAQWLGGLYCEWYWW